MIKHTYKCEFKFYYGYMYIYSLNITADVQEKRNIQLIPTQC